MFFELSQNWWALALRGIAAIIFGVLALFWPGLTLLVFVFLFAFYAVTDGIFAIIAAVRVHRAGERWWPLLLEGILGIAAGVIALLMPGITALLLLYIIAFWSLIIGILEIATTIRLRREISNEWIGVLGGIASILIGILLLAFPRAGALALVLWIGAYAIIFGVLLLIYAFHLRAEGRKSLHYV